MCDSQILHHLYTLCSIMALVRMPSMAVKIAVIEDDQPIAMMYQFKLEQAGFRTAVALDGLSGLEIIKSFEPDLVLLDLMMPHLSGEDMLEQLRATDWGSGIR